MRCRSCGEDVDRLVKAKSEGKAVKVCEDCSERLEQEAEIGRAAQAVIGGAMEYKGRRSE